MTTTVSLKTAVIAAVMLALFVPAMSFAATPSVSELQTQYQTLMSRFEEMKERREGNASSTKATTTRERGDKASTTVNRTCMATAVATREASLKTAWNTFSTSFVTAFDKRTTALIAAWNATDTGNRDAYKEAWSNWKTERKAAQTKLKSDRKAAWDTFKKTARETCKVSTPKEEGLEKSGSDSIVL
ncbi:MAG: hypothetical protein RLZZ360_862 [Candidatus Parcubacteria bacterium]|jgi:hypothetical protein